MITSGKPRKNIETLRNTVFSYFSEDSSIPESGTPYYGYSGALKCLSEGAGDVAFAKDSTVDSYCDNEDPSENEEWCLEIDEYVPLPAFGRSPSRPVMYNPEFMDVSTMELLTDSLVGMSDDTEGAKILENILNTGGIVKTNAQDHLGSYSTMISNIPGF